MGQGTSEPTVGVDRARELVAAGEAAVIDVRDADEWGEAHIPGAVRADPDDLESTLEELGDERQVLVVCQRGKRSREIAGKLREAGRDDARSIEGGMEAWQAQGHGIQPARPDVDYEFHGPGDKPPGV